MHTRTGMVTSPQRLGVDGTLYVRNRSTGEVFGYPHRPGPVGPGSYGPPVRIGTGFLPEVAPVLAAGDFHGDGGLELLCVLPGGAEVLLPVPGSVAASDLASGSVTASGLTTGSVTASDRPAGSGTASAPTTQVVVVRSVKGRPAQVLRAAPDGTVRLSTALAPDDGETLTTIDPGAVLLGMGDVTGTGRPNLLLRRTDGGVSACEFLSTPGAGRLWHDLGAGFDDAVVVGATDVGGDGLADLLAIGRDGRLWVFPHSGVFWPQYPAVTFLTPVPVADGVDAFDVIG
ncbi:hypothetical protein ACI2K4_25670 [Micromonospora sp. NPDC050397]|uniref:hypothetical protein n=1 Tax=Micromonospora sp. NPDC050397 TaxID=3364279 RepID=UPI00384D6C72